MFHAVGNPNDILSLCSRSHGTALVRLVCLAYVLLSKDSAWFCFFQQGHLSQASWNLLSAEENSVAKVQKSIQTDWHEVELKEKECKHVSLSIICSRAARCTHLEGQVVKIECMDNNGVGEAVSPKGLSVQAVSLTIHQYTSNYRLWFGCPLLSPQVFNPQVFKYLYDCWWLSDSLTKWLFLTVWQSDQVIVYDCLFQVIVHDYWQFDSLTKSLLLIALLQVNIYGCLLSGSLTKWLLVIAFSKCLFMIADNLTVWPSACLWLLIPSDCS